MKLGQPGFKSQSIVEWRTKQGLPDFKNYWDQMKQDLATLGTKSVTEECHKTEHLNPMTMRDYVKLYRDGEDVAIQTNITSEETFVREVSDALGGKLLSVGEDASFVLQSYLPQIIDICAKLRGYKAPLVDEQIVLTAGRLQPNDAMIFGERNASAVA